MDLAAKGTTITLRNASIELIRGSMRLSGGTIESANDQVTPNVSTQASAALGLQFYAYVAAMISR